MEGREHQSSTFSGRQVLLEMGKLRVGGSGRPVPAVFPTASSKRARTGPQAAAVAPQPEVQSPFLSKTVVQRPGRLSTSHVFHASNIHKVATQSNAAHANPSKPNEKSFDTTHKHVFQRRRSRQKTLQSNPTDKSKTTRDRKPTNRSFLDENDVDKPAKVHAIPIVATLRSVPTVPHVYTARELALFTHHFEPRHATSTDTTRYHKASHSHARSVPLSSLTTVKPGARSWQHVHASLDHLYEADETIGLMPFRKLHPSTLFTARKKQRQVEHARTRTATFTLREEQSKKQQRWTEKQQRKVQVAHLSMAIRRQNQTKTRRLSSDRNEQRVKGVQTTEKAGTGGTRKPPVPRLSRYFASGQGQEAKLTRTGVIKGDGALMDKTKISEAKERGIDTVIDVQVKAAIDNVKQAMPWKRPRVLKPKQELGMADESVQAAKRARETRRALARDYMQYQQQSRRRHEAKMREQAQCEKMKRQWQLERLEATRLKKLRSARKKVRADARVEDGTMKTMRGTSGVRGSLERDVGKVGTMKHGVESGGEGGDGSRNEEQKTEEETRGTAVDDVVDARVQRLLELQAKTTALSARLSGLRHQRDQMETVEESSQMVKVSFQMDERKKVDDEKRASLVDCHVLEETPLSKPEQEQERERDGDEEEGIGGEGASGTSCHSIPSTRWKLKSCNPIESIELKGNAEVEFHDDEHSVVSVDWKAWKERDKRTDEHEEMAIRSIGVHNIHVVWPLEQHQDANKGQSFDASSSSSSSSCTSSRLASPVVSQWRTFPSTCREEAKEEVCNEEVTTELNPFLPRKRDSESESDGFATTRLIRLIRETDDSLSVIDRVAQTLYDQQRIIVEDENEMELQARMQAEKRALIVQDEKVAAVMASLIDLEGTRAEDEEVEGTDEKKDVRYKRLEEIMAEVEQERDGENRLSSECDKSLSSHDALDDKEEAGSLSSGQDSSDALASSVFWDHVVATSRLESTPPRKAMDDASGLACNLIRPQRSDTQRGEDSEETERKESPQTLATKLLAAVDYQEAMVNAHQQLAKMADAFQREQEVKRAQLRECSVQTETLRQVDAATCATLCVETSTSPIRGGVDAAVQVNAMMTAVDQVAVEGEKEKSWEHSDDAYDETFEALSQDDEAEMDGSGVDGSLVLSQDYEEEEEALDGLADADASGLESVIEEDVVRHDASGEASNVIASMELRDEFESEEQDERDEQDEQEEQEEQEEEDEEDEEDEKRGEGDEMDEQVDEDESMERSEAMVEEFDEESGRVNAVGGEASREGRDSNELVRSRTIEAMQDVEEERVDRMSARAQECSRLSNETRETMEAQSAAYRGDLERRQQAEASLLQLRLATLEQKYRGRVYQLERRDDGDGAFQRQNETLTMAFMAEKAHVESLLAASKARFYHDLHSFQSLLLEWPRAVDHGEQSPRPVFTYQRGGEQGFVAVEASLDRAHATVSDEEYADEFVCDSGGSHDALMEERDEEVDAMASRSSLEEIKDSGQDHGKDVDTIERKAREFEVNREVDESVEEVEDGQGASVEEKEDGQETSVERLVDDQGTSVGEVVDDQETSVEEVGYNQETSVGEEEKDYQETSVEEVEDDRETPVEEEEDGQETSVEEEESEHETLMEVAEDDRETSVEGSVDDQGTSVGEVEDEQEMSVEEVGYDQETFGSMSEASTSHREEILEGKSVDFQVADQTSAHSDQEYGDDFVSIDESFEKGVECHEHALKAIENVEPKAATSSMASSSEPVAMKASESEDSSLTTLLVNEITSLQQEQTTVRWSEAEARKFARKQIQICDLLQAKARLIHHATNVFRRDEAKRQLDHVARLALDVNVAQHVSWAKDAIVQDVAREVAPVYESYAILKVQADLPVSTKEEGKVSVLQKLFDLTKGREVSRVDHAKEERRVDEKEMEREGSRGYEEVESEEAEERIDSVEEDEWKEERQGERDGMDQVESLVDEVERRAVEMEEEMRTVATSSIDDEHAYSSDSFDDAKSLVESDHDEDDARYSTEEFDSGSVSLSSAMHGTESKRGEETEHQGLDDRELLAAIETVGTELEAVASCDDEDAWMTASVEARMARVAALQQAIVARKQQYQRVHQQLRVEKARATLVAREKELWDEMETMERVLGVEEAAVVACGQRNRVELLALEWKHQTFALDKAQERRDEVVPDVEAEREARGGTGDGTGRGAEKLDGYTYIEAAEAGTLLACRGFGRIEAGDGTMEWAKRADGGEKCLENGADGTGVLGDYDYVEAVAMAAFGPVDWLAAYDYVERIEGVAFKSKDALDVSNEEEEEEEEAKVWTEGALTLRVDGSGLVAKEVEPLRDERDGCNASNMTKQLDRVTDLLYADVIQGLDEEMIFGSRALAVPSHGKQNEAEFKEQDDELINGRRSKNPSLILHPVISESEQAMDRDRAYIRQIMCQVQINKQELRFPPFDPSNRQIGLSTALYDTVQALALNWFCTYQHSMHHEVLVDQDLILTQLEHSVMSEIDQLLDIRAQTEHQIEHQVQVMSMDGDVNKSLSRDVLVSHNCLDVNVQGLVANFQLDFSKTSDEPEALTRPVKNSSLLSCLQIQQDQNLQQRIVEMLLADLFKDCVDFL